MNYFFEEKFLDNSLVVDFEDILINCKKNNFSAKDTCTRNGFQTPNLFDYKLIEEKKINSLSQEIMKIFGKERSYLFHIHLIEYEKGGYQKAHDHKQTEDYSFILYLNDSDGNTVFDTIGVETVPEKGKIIFFSSDLWHWAKPSKRNKKIVVGAIKTI